MPARVLRRSRPESPQAIEAVIYGRQTPKDAMDAATKDAQVVLDRALRRKG